MMPKILIIGAGFSGVVIARQLAEYGCKVTIIERRNHIGGNAYDFKNEHGITIHKYGPHLFHTSNLKVINWISRFSKWIDYKHKVKAILQDGQFVTLPVNLDTTKIVGEENIIDIFYRPYSKKMWGVDIEDIDPSILNRVPVRKDHNEFYFPNDSFQALPSDGYTSLFKSIIDHHNIELKLSTEFIKGMDQDYEHTFNSMSIDEFYEYRFGRLDYRSIKFHNYTLPISRILPVATVNFTDNHAFTRVTEWKNLPVNSLNTPFTTLTIEEPCPDFENNFERYYPVKDIYGVNKSLYLKYRSINREKMTFIGRCGQYVYLNMDQAISAALSISNRYIHQHKSDGNFHS